MPKISKTGTSSQHLFKADITFEKILDDYIFDRKLPLLSGTKNVSATKS